MLRTGAEHGGVQNADNPHKGKYAKIRESQVATLRQIPRDADAPLGKFHALSLIGEQQSREEHCHDRRPKGPKAIDIDCQGNEDALDNEGTDDLDGRRSHISFSGEHIKPHDIENRGGEAAEQTADKSESALGKTREQIRPAKEKPQGQREHGRILLE